MKITVLGSGAFGTALSLVLLENGHDVTLWSYTREQSQALERTRRCPKLPGVELPEGLKYTSDMAAVKGCGMVVLATPSYAVRATAQQLKPLVEPGTILVCVSKGIEADTALCLSQVIRREIGELCPVAVLSGPSHAEEVSRRIPTGVVAAAEDPEVANQVQAAFLNQRFRVYTSDDVIGTEICAALKNVIALCAGCCDGMGHGDNTKALLMTRGLAEMVRLGEAMGGRRESFTGLAGVGDLIATCTSVHSRNRKCGFLIGQGKSVDEAIREVGAVVEGYYAAASALALARKAGVEMPVALAAHGVLYQNRDPHEALDALMSRTCGSEFEQGWD